MYAKKFEPKLYVMLQLFTQAVTSAILAVVLNFLEIGGERVDEFIFTPDPLLILAIVGIGILTNSVCWTVRTAAMRYVSPTAVAIIMPFSAVVTGVFAVAIGQDEPTVSLVVGAVLGLLAGLISSIGDLKENGGDDPTRVEKTGDPG
jgi:drug/metabolite transporter (DMT)-like permease